MSFEKTPENKKQEQEEHSCGCAGDTLVVMIKGLRHELSQLAAEVKDIRDDQKDQIADVAYLKGKADEQKTSAAAKLALAIAILGPVLTAFIAHMFTR